MIWAYIFCFFVLACVFMFYLFFFIVSFYYRNQIPLIQNKDTLHALKVLPTGSAIAQGGYTYPIKLAEVLGRCAIGWVDNIDP